MVAGRARLRIVHVAGSAEWGGGERYLELLAQRLDPDRFEMSVVLPEEGPFEAHLERLRVPVRVVDLTRLVSLPAIVRLATSLRAMAPDLVQSHGARSNFYSRLATALLRRPLHISTIHNSLVDYPISSLRRSVYRSMDRLTLPLTARVLCVADALAREYRARVTVIRNGVDLSRFGPDADHGTPVRSDLGVGAGPVVGFAGRLTPPKDPTTFLRAVAGVRREFPEATALIVGDGPLRAGLELEAARLGIAGHCVFTGFRPDIVGYLRAMDVFVLSSWSEGLPFMLLEAMATGRPVVATAINGVTEIVQTGVNGLLVPRADVPAMTHAVLDLLRHPARARALGAAGRAHIADHFGIDRMIEETERLYVELWGDRAD